MVTKPAFWLDKVTFHYGQTPILRDLEFVVPPGQIVAVLGPNGMGKTTLLKLCAGVLAPFRGDVWVEGNQRRSSVKIESEIRKRTVFLPADAWFPPEVTVRRYVLQIAKLYGRDELEAMDHAESLFQLFEMDKKADCQLARLSTGQKRKAAICATLVTDAPLMLLDEPFSGGLDPAGIVAMKHLLKGYSTQDNRSIVFTTPVPEIIEDVADRIVILKDGQLVADGSAKELREQSRCETLEQAIESMMHTDTLNRVKAYFNNVS